MSLAVADTVTRRLLLAPVERFGLAQRLCRLEHPPAALFPTTILTEIIQSTSTRESGSFLEGILDAISAVIPIPIDQPTIRCDKSQDIFTSDEFSSQDIRIADNMVLMSRDLYPKYIWSFLGTPNRSIQKYQPGIGITLLLPPRF